LTKENLLVLDQNVIINLKQNIMKVWLIIKKILDLI